MGRCNGCDRAIFLIEKEMGGDPCKGLRMVNTETGSLILNDYITRHRSWGEKGAYNWLKHYFRDIYLKGELK